MFLLKNFFALEWKSFKRSPSFETKVAIKILMGFGALYFMVVFTLLGLGIYYILAKEAEGDPWKIINQYIVYYFLFDLVFRYMLQKMPITRIKQFLFLPIKKGKIVSFSLLKSVFSFFNWVHLFTIVPLIFVLIKEGYPVLKVISWGLSVFLIIIIHNFINVLANSVDKFLYIILGILVTAGVCQYYGLFDITYYTGILFELYSQPYGFSIPLVTCLVAGLYTHTYFRKQLYLDDFLAKKTEKVVSRNYSWLDKYGNRGIFLKNDLRLIFRNKRPKMAVLMGVFFLFYGLFFFTQAGEYQPSFMNIFAGIFVTGGFLFGYGSYVPSWDSSYYDLLMSQNITYRDYLDSKWWLIVVACAISAVLSIPYIYFGREAIEAMAAGAIYNIGVNAYMVLWGGAYIKTPIDLTKAKKAFGDTQSLNAKTMLTAIPKIVLPVLIFALGKALFNTDAGYALVALFGIAGLGFKNTVLKRIERLYKSEKYDTIKAYKTKP